MSKPNTALRRLCSELAENTLNANLYYPAFLFNGSKLQIWYENTQKIMQLRSRLAFTKNKVEQKKLRQQVFMSSGWLGSGSCLSYHKCLKI
jgi:hypothetical protein